MSIYIYTDKEKIAQDIKKETNNIVHSVEVNYTSFEQELFDLEISVHGGTTLLSIDDLKLSELSSLVESLTFNSPCTDENVEILAGRIFGENAIVSEIEDQDEPTFAIYNDDIDEYYQLGTMYETMIDGESHIKIYIWDEF